ncbi:hypothetical protein GCM10011375_24780 [Hymenobacter qilianensis]|uniref:Uncharacterized protein n=1 Tax=Hymenobacter qilianensis TaxID=1385715 RepID=A0ACB5PSY6_9BACT|nr:hypothetical protein GCM10011375_24780 [Hymenobacter qilianensis]
MNSKVTEGRKIDAQNSGGFFRSKQKMIDKVKGPTSVKKSALSVIYNLLALALVGHVIGVCLGGFLWPLVAGQIRLFTTLAYRKD